MIDLDAEGAEEYLRPSADSTVNEDVDSINRVKEILASHNWAQGDIKKDLAKSGESGLNQKQLLILAT